MLLFAALAVPLLAFWPTDQGDAATDWPAHVDKACTSTRFGIRIAAARKVAEGGDAAVPALVAWEAKHGRNLLPPTLVDAIADAAPAAYGPGTLALLRRWADDVDFYWRGSAMRGIALRAPGADDALRTELGQRFVASHGDPAWLTRTHARFGSALLGDTAVLALPEADPRARVRLAALLLGRGIVPPLQPLLDALADERTFLGDPWGQRLGTEAHKALKTWLGDGHPLAGGGSFADRTAAIEALRAAAASRSGQELRTPVPATDPELAFAGGIEILSCKHGDVFVRWTEAGELVAGLDAAARVTLPAPAWDELQRARRELTLASELGVVICDSMRLFWTQPAVHAKVAPRSLPAAATNWLEQLARRVEEAGGTGIGRDLRAGIDQFAAR
ncbi:MAG: hypothetical protein JNM25_07570 [Planctomycetes bacterium]|nr:hypothetical protein [Planctomycetota bacterium]